MSRMTKSGSPSRGDQLSDQAVHSVAPQSARRTMSKTRRICQKRFVPCFMTQNLTNHRLSLQRGNRGKYVGYSEGLGTAKWRAGSSGKNPPAELSSIPTSSSCRYITPPRFLTQVLMHQVWMCRRNYLPQRASSSQPICGKHRSPPER